jgi:general secretion pathway protein G
MPATAEEEPGRRVRRFWITAGLGCSGLGGIVLLVVLTALVLPNVLYEFSITHCGKAKPDIAAIEAALKEYSNRNGGRFPDSLEELVIPDVDGNAYLDTKQVPRDPWGREYIYIPPGPGQPRPIIRSYGRDGQPGGKGDDADIDNLSLLRD